MNYEELLLEFKKWVVSDEKSQALWKKAVENNASYRDADLYSQRVANWWSKKLQSNYSDVDYEKVSKNISEALKKTYSETAYYSKTVQSGINSKAKIGMKALEPRIDEDRISNLIEKLVDEDATFLLSNRVVENIGKQAISDTIESNARVQDKAGLKTMIVRHVGSNGCCAWCESMAGEYAYDERPDDIFRFHDNCTCWIDYRVSKYNITRTARNDSRIKTTIVD